MYRYSRLLALFALFTMMAIAPYIALAAPSSGCLTFAVPYLGFYNASYVAGGPFYAGETVTIDVPSTTTFSLLVDGVVVIPSSSTPDTFSYTFPANAGYIEFSAGTDYNATISCKPAPGESFPAAGPARATDDRLDRNFGAPIAVYCRYEGFHVYQLDGEIGALALTVTVDQIAAVGDSPAENTLIASGSDIRLYRLTTGEFQVHYGPDADGEEYIYRWRTCDPDTGTEATMHLQ